MRGLAVLGVASLLLAAGLAGCAAIGSGPTGTVDKLEQEFVDKNKKELEAALLEMEQEHRRGGE